jgi:hypothetical protein
MNPVKHLKRFDEWRNPVLGAFSLFLAVMTLVSIPSSLLHGLINSEILLLSLLFGGLFCLFLLCSQLVPVHNKETRLVFGTVVTMADSISLELSYPKERPLWPFMWPRFLRNHRVSMSLRNHGFKKGDLVRLTIEKVVRQRFYWDEPVYSMHQPVG